MTIKFLLESGTDKLLAEDSSYLLLEPNGSKLGDVLRTPWTRQPLTQSLRVNWDNPLTRGLISLIPLNGIVAFDYVRNVLGTPTAISDTRANRQGQFPLFGNGATRYYSFPALRDGLIATNGQMSIGWTQEVIGVTSFSTVYDISPYSGAGSIVCYQSASSSGYAFTCGPRISLGARQFATALLGGVNIPNNTIDSFVWTAINCQTTTASDLTVYRNQKAGVTADGTNSFTNNSTSKFLIGVVTASSDPFDGLIGNLAIWNRVLSAEEAHSYNENPYQVWMG